MNIGMFMRIFLRECNLLSENYLAPSLTSVVKAFNSTVVIALQLQQ